MTAQRNAPNVKHVVSADAFGSLAGIPGVVVQRVGGHPTTVSIRGVPGELNSIQIDGNRRVTQNDRAATFDSIGVDNLESIELIKSPTPDMDADAIGGTVNLKSRSAFDLTGRRATFTAGGLIGWRRYPVPLPSATVKYSNVYDVLGGSRNFGIALTGFFHQHNAAMDFSTMNYQNTANQPAFMRSLTYDGRISLRSRMGAAVRLDYKLSEGNTLFANVTSMPRSGRVHLPAYTISTAQTIATLNAQGVPTGTGAILPGFTRDRTEARNVAQSQVSQRYLHREIDIDNETAQFGGRIQRGVYELDYDVSYSYEKQNQFYHQSSALVRGVGFVLDRTRTSKWTPELTFTSGPDPINLDNYADNLLLRFQQPTKGTLVGAQVNYLRRFDSPVRAYLKTGLKVRSEKQAIWDLSRRWNFTGADGALSSGDERLSQFVSEAWTYAPYHGAYPNIPVISPGEMKEHLAANPNLWREDVVYAATQRLNNRQDLEERAYAGYILGNVRLGKVSVLGGVRVEQTELEGEGPQNRITAEERARRVAWVGPLTDAENIRRVEAQYGGRRTTEGDYRKVFPGLHFKYEPKAGIIMRLSYASSMGRPNFDTILPRDVVNEENRVLNINNTGLRPQYSNNFDAMVEYYFEPVGQLSAGVFLKEINDFIYNTTGTFIGTGSDNGFNGDYAGFELRSQANGGFARIRGWEVNYRQQFTFLPGWLGGFGAFANYTWLETKGDYGGNAVQSTGTLVNFTPKAANIGVSYIRGKFNLRLNYGMAGETLIAFNAQQHLRRYRPQGNRVEIKTRYPIGRGYDVYLDVYNLTNDKQRDVFGVPDRPRLILDRNDPQIHFGINGRF